MAITVTAALTNVGPNFSDSPLNGIVTVVNNGANTISIYAIQMTEATQTGAVCRQPDFLVPNAAPGTYPTIASAGTAYYPFAVMCPSPNMPGAGPSAPNALHGNTWPAGNSQIQLNCLVTAYDSTAGAYVNGSASLLFPVTSGVATFPVPVGGAEQFNAGGDAVNWFFF